MSVAPDPTAGAYSAPPKLLVGFKGAASLQDGNGLAEEKEGHRWARGKREWNERGQGWRKERGIAPWLLAT